MSEQSKVASRMLDVLIALSEAGRSNIALKRIQLQKFIYLSEALGQLVGVLAQTNGYKTYKRGPYDSSIQNAVDSLAFRGIVSIVSMQNLPNEQIASSYKLSDAGKNLVKKIKNDDRFSRRVRLGTLIGNNLSIYGWNNIVSLVYAEPTYLAARKRGFGIELPVNDGLSASAAAVIATASRVAFQFDTEESSIDPWIAERFFYFLHIYSLRNSSTTNNDL